MLQTAIFPSKQTLTVKRIFEDNGNWEQFCLDHKGILRNVEIVEQKGTGKATYYIIKLFDAMVDAKYMIVDDNAFI